MIYEFPDPDVPIRQGDIFVGLPRVEISLREVVLIDGEEERVATWDELSKKNDPSDLIVPVRSVAARSRLASAGPESAAARRAPQRRKFMGSDTNVVAEWGLV